MPLNKPDKPGLDCRCSIQQSRLQSLRDMHLDLPDSFTLVGVPDASGSIPAGEVVVVGRDGRVVVPAGRTVLLYRYPGGSAAVGAA